MKKLLLIVAMAAITMSVALWGQSITVTSPAAGNEWCLGSAQTITWIKSGDMQATAAIRLRVAGSPESADAAVTIANGTANDGSYPWVVPNSVAPGSYFIRVRTDDSTVIGDSAIFTISSCPASIIVTSPVATDDWCIGNPYMINWTKSGPMQATVAIRLREAGSPESAAATVTIANGTANDGSHPWTVPVSVAPGNYFIRVRTDDSTVIGDSANFEVKDCSGPSITVTKPSATHGWCTGRAGLIQWTKSGVMSAFVKIILYSAPYSPGGIGNILTAHTSNDGEYSWNVPDDKAPGDYVVKVQTTTGSISDFSETFKIYRCIDPDILKHLEKIRYYIRIPRWPPEPDPWWKIDFGEFREIMHNKFEGSVFLLKNGQKVKEIGKFGKTSPLPDTLKFKMGEMNSKSLKNNNAKFSIGIFNAQGKMMQETPLEVQVGQQLRH
ncbi:MAG: hypothetical protein JW976_05640 [Syntrophaceae bacterium]|nr:hypothetical protein [Syntrophaceae bacterium]